jgi:hypothetical protein
MTPFADSAAAISAVEMVAACGVALASGEWLMNARHLRDDALLSWPISQLRHRALADGFLPRVLNPLFGYPGILWMLSVRLAAALFLLFSVPPGPGGADNPRDRLAISFWFGRLRSDGRLHIRDAGADTVVSASRR